MKLTRFWNTSATGLVWNATKTHQLQPLIYYEFGQPRYHTSRKDVKGQTTATLGLTYQMIYVCNQRA